MYIYLPHGGRVNAQARIHIHVYIHIYVYTCTQIYINMYVHTCMYVHICMCVCVFTTWGTYAYLYVCLCIIHICIYRSLLQKSHTNMHMCVCVFTTWGTCQTMRPSTRNPPLCTHESCRHHVTHIDEDTPCHKYTFVMSLVCMSHVSHMNGSCITHEWVLS